MAPDSYHTLRFDQVVRKHTHNSYQRDESLFDQALYNMVRSLELDIHLSKGGHTEQGDWFVYHTIKQESDTTCRTLSDGLTRIAALGAVIPKHEIMTVWIEFKDNVFGDNHHTPSGFDALIKGVIDKNGEGLILTPADLMGRSEWPVLSELRSKYVFVLLANDRGRDALNEYRNYNGLAFIQEDGSPLRFNNRSADRWKNDPVPGNVNRVTKANTPDEWRNMLESNSQYAGTDKVDEVADGWAFTHNMRGWPFTVINQSSDDYIEESAAIAVQVQSGDIWDKSDSFFFLYHQIPDVSSSNGFELSCYISVPDTRGESWAKGCLMARADTDPDSPYFAVCRAAGNHPTQIQFRRKRGGETERRIIRPDSAVGKAENQYAFANITLRDGITNGNASLPCFDSTGSGFADEPVSFDEALNLVGIAASSHDERPHIRFVFGAVTLKESSRETVFHSQNLEHAKVGDVGVANAQDGVWIG